MNITIIGGGNMGLTYALSVHTNFKDTNISILEKDASKIEQLKKDTPFNVYSDPSDCIPNAEIIFLAVKPQYIGEVFTQILPAQVGHGVTGFIASAEVTNDETTKIQSILSATGTAIKVPTEESIDAITSLSGSGPAYVFYFMNSMIKKAVEFGFNETEAKDIVLNTFLGTAKLFESSDTLAQTWIEKVTSKGGTTHAALTSFKENNLEEKIKKGVQSAFDRAQELGN